MIHIDSEDRSARERILAAAEGLFAERGFDRTSTARIAAAAKVPQGLIFYYFKTKMDLLLAVTEGFAATVLGELTLPAPVPDDLSATITALWVRLSAVVGEPSAMSRILFQELSAHPEIRQRAADAHQQVTAVISGYLARACGHDGVPRPEHDAAARLLSIGAAMAPMLDQPGGPSIDPATVSSVIAHGL